MGYQKPVLNRENAHLPVSYYPVQISAWIFGTKKVALYQNKVLHLYRFHTVKQRQK